MTSRAFVRFALVAEGSSDGGLVRILKDLCVRCGAEEALGDFPRLDHLPARVGHRAENKVTTALELLPDTNLVFVHRDADRHAPEKVRSQIAAALRRVEAPPHVAVVPVREMEAWLLTDAKAIREVVGNSNGRAALPLPPLRKIEDVPDPKALLREALVIASELTGRRAEAVKQQFPLHRRGLLDTLDLDGPVSSLPAIVRLRTDISAALKTLP